MSYKKPGTLKWPNVGPNFVPEFQISSLPWATSSQVTPGQAEAWKFYRVTRFITVVNAATGSANVLKVGFTANGVNDENYILIPPGEQLSDELKLTQLHIKGDAGAVGPTQYSILAGITGCDPRQYPVLTGSVGFEGVG